MRIVVGHAVSRIGLAGMTKPKARTTVAEVMSLADDGFKAVYTLPPREAVIAAYAQYGHGDWNTWDYETQYGHLVVTSCRHVSCGDYCAWLPECDLEKTASSLADEITSVLPA